MIDPRPDPAVQPVDQPTAVAVPADPRLEPTFATSAAPVLQLLGTADAPVCVDDTCLPEEPRA